MGICNFYKAKIKSVNLKEYTKIFIPGFQDHPEELILVNRILRRMVLFQWCRAEVYEYEVWTPMLNPDKMLDISDVIDKVLCAVSKYHSQLECYDYINLCKGLNSFRGCTHILLSMQKCINVD